MIHHVTRATRHLIFWSLILAALALSGVRLMLKSVESYKSDLETRIGVMVGTPVKLGGISANMRGVSPELVLKSISLAPTLTTEKPAVSLDQIRLGIDLGAFLLNRDLVSSSWVTLVGAKLSVLRNPEGQFVVDGLKAGNGSLLWLLQGRQYMILQSHITFHDQLKAAPPVELEAVNLAIRNDGERHRINLMTKLPQQYGDGLKASLVFDSVANKFSDIEGSLFFAANKVKLPEWVSAYLPFNIKMQTGSADVNVWSYWRQGKPYSVRTDAQLHKATFSRPGRDTFQLSYLDSQIDAQLKDQNWQLTINKLLLETLEANKKITKKWPDMVVNLAGEKTPDNQLRNFKLFAEQVDLAEVAKLAYFFGPLNEDQLGWLTQAQPSGLLKDFSLYLEPASKNIALAGRFDAVSFEPFLTVPGLTNLSGQIKGSDKIGQIELVSQNVQYEQPKLFSQPLKLNRLSGVFDWQQTGTQWSISSPAIAIDCSLFKSESRLLAEISKSDAKPFIDLQTSFHAEDISQVKAYLPTEIMKDKLKTWLTNAFVGGKVTKGDLLFFGKVSDFPFTDNSGVFEASLALDKVELRYHPEWPKINSIKGDLFFVQDKILGKFQGITEKVAISKADMQISNLGTDELLTIAGGGQGEINQALGILRQSPLVNKVAPLLAGITLQGTTKANLDLAIPLRPGHEIKVDGKAQLHNAQLTVNRMDLRVSNIIGNLKFNKFGIYGEKIQAKALERSIQVNINQEEQRTLVDVTGKATVNAIETLFAWPDSQLAEGEADYLLQLGIPKTLEGSNPLDITVQSTLEGVVLDLPGALAKSKEQEKPTQITLSLSDRQVLPMALDYNNELKAAINFDINEHKISSGHILIGNGTARQTKNPGIKFEVNREQLPLQQWLAIASSAQQSGKSAVNVSEIKVHSQSALWNKTRLGVFDLSLKQTTNGWAGDIESVYGKGKLQFPVDTGNTSSINLDMDMLNLTALKQLKLQEDVNSNTGIKPLINMNSKRTLWQGGNLGQLTLTTGRTANGIHIKQLELVSDDQKLSMTGNWREAGINSTTHLHGKLDIQKADQLFDKLNITKDLTGTSGVIDFKLDWNGSPWQLSLPALHGSLDVDLKEGRILSIEPGFGRVLGILAVAQWIKRLQLDFSDIYEEGLTFDSIQGHFDLIHGIAATKGLVIDAVPAKITITGDTDLAKQTVDQVIKVVPKSLDAVPIAGTIVSRIAAMVGKTLTGKDQEGFFFGTQYLVKGSWDDVKISSLHENDGLIQKTWNSITDFPWNEEEK